MTAEVWHKIVYIDKTEDIVRELLTFHNRISTTLTLSNNASAMYDVIVYY